MNLILSICIPTYNRKAYLKQCLEKLIPGVQNFKIPIYISDNASNDGTEDMVRQFMEEYELIFYQKKIENQGIDRNMLDVIQMTNTRYAWWLGDDDIIINENIEALLNLLKSNSELSFLLLNAKFISNDLNIEIGKTTLEITRNENYNDCKQFFKECCFNMSFGTLIINVAKFKNNNYNHFIGTSHAYSGAVFDYLAKEYLEFGSNNIILFSVPTVYLRCGDKSWVDSSVKIYLIEVPEWFKQINRFYSPISEKILNEYLRTQSRFKILLSYRCSGQLALANVRMLTEALTLRGKINAFLISLLPISIARICYAIRNVRTKIKKIRLDFNK